MKEATPEELRERYRELPDSRLLILAAEASGLTPEAAAALHQELKNRKLNHLDIAETSASVGKWRAQESEPYAEMFNLRKQIGYGLIDLVYFLGMLCILLL